MEEQSVHEFNRRAQGCSNHRMVMVSSETVFENNNSIYAKPVRTLYSYRCNGSCGQHYQIETKD